MNIIFDLDGTLIDSKLRLYRLFQDLVPYSTLTFEQYWSFKYEKITNEIILQKNFRFTNTAIDDFKIKWMSLIESDQYLVLDKCFEGVHATLERLNDLADLYVCTARQYRDCAIGQLVNLNLFPFFKNVLITEQKCSKESLIASSVYGLSSHDWIIGDTGKDIQTGKFLNMNTCAVLSGFLNAESLEKYHPDLIIDNVVNFDLFLKNEIF